AYWWADRMLITPQPLQEKMALFWHGHFATNEDKVRDYRKMLRQLDLFQQQGTGNFRTLLIGVAQDPAMLAFRDAARAFTGWNFRNLTFQVDPGKHDDGAKTFLGKSGDFDGVAVIDLILQ